MSDLLVDRSAAMAELWDSVIALGQTIPDEQWDAPVPWCPQWTVADLVSHLGGLQSTMNGSPQPAVPRGWQPPTTGSVFDIAMAPVTAARRDWTPQQRLDELRVARDGHAAALRAVEEWSEPTQGPVGPTTQDGLFRIRAFDVWVHLQDLREALGLPVELDDDSPAAAAAHEHVAALMPWLLVKRAGAGDRDVLHVSLAPPLARDGTIRVVDGRARWEDRTEAEGDRVTGAPAALTLLTSGRGTPQRWRDAGALEWSGDLAAAFVERARTF